MTFWEDETTKWKPTDPKSGHKGVYPRCPRCGFDFLSMDRPKILPVIIMPADMIVGYECPECDYEWERGNGSRWPDREEIERAVLYDAIEFSSHESALGHDSWSVNTRATIQKLHEAGYRIAVAEPDQ